MRISKRECYLLARAAEFVLAGEWPWESDRDPGVEAEHLERAAMKLRARVPDSLEHRDGKRRAIARNRAR